MNGERGEKDKDDELEALLRGIVPSPLDVEFVAGLNRERERVRLLDEQSPMRMQWSRVIPLTLVCSVVMFGFALYRYGDRLGDARRAAAYPGVAEVPTNSADQAPEDIGIPAPDSRFIPVSSHGTIVNASSAGIVETESGPRQRLNFEIRDAYHWHDPESGTNIRYFQPRTEEVIVPFPTD